MDDLIYNQQMWVTDTNPVVLVDSVKRCLLLSGMKAFNFAEHHFSPQGYTCFWLLAESHVAVHTFPERCVTYIEISCCNQERMGKLVRYISEELHVKTL